MGSFGVIFQRNVIKNRLVCVEGPGLIVNLTAVYARVRVRGACSQKGELTLSAEHRVRASTRDGVVEPMSPEGKTKRYKVRPVGLSVQEL